nr:hypothetical protein [Tanacetum cinerariifolium]
MSSIDTYSTTKDLVFDEWVSSHRSDKIRFDVYFDGRFFMCPLKYEDETILDLMLPMSKRLSFKEMNGLLLDKTKEYIWKWFYYKPKCTLKEGKVLLDDFEIVGNGKDKVVLDDVKDGLIGNGSRAAMTRILIDLCHKVTGAVKDKARVIKEVKELGVATQGSDSMAYLRMLRDEDLDKVKDIMNLIKETQKHTHRKLGLDGGHLIAFGFGLAGGEFCSGF